MTISGPSTVNEDATYTLDLSATGNPSNHPITSWTINWGDGSAPQTVTGNPSSVTYSFTPTPVRTRSRHQPTKMRARSAAAPRQCHGRGRAADRDDQRASTVNEDATYTLDLSATGNPSNHPITSWTINWGDGSDPQTIEGNPSSVTYSYADAGSYTITASATEDEGTFAAAAPVT